MKYLMISLVGVCLLLTSVPAMADQAADEAAIREASEKIMAAFNEHDVETALALYDEKIEMWDGTYKGRAGQEKGYIEYFKIAKNAHMKPLEEIGIVFITPDVAIHKMRREMTGIVDMDGKAQPDVKEIHARVFVKRDGKWLLAAYFSAPIEE